MKKIIYLGMIVLVLCISGGCNDSTSEVSTEAYNDVESVTTEKTNFSLKEKNFVCANTDLEISSCIENPVIERGEDGEWDDTDVLNPSVVVFNNKYYNYYSGWDGETWATGLATSDDGINWKKYEENPVLYVGQDGLDNEYIAANGSAIVIDEKIYYYYQGQKNGEAYVALATSSDGINFVKEENPVLTGSAISGEWDECGVADPYVIEYNGAFYMYYLGINDVSIQRLGVAVSTDGINWSRSVANPILDIGTKNSFDTNGLGEPSVVYYAPYFYMVYTGRDSNENRNIGYALSSDGINWRKYSTEGLFDSQIEWNSKVICDTTFILDEDSGILNVWYGGGNIAAPAQDLNGKIGFFTIDLANGRDATKIDNSIDERDVLKDILVGGYVEDTQIWASDEVEFTLLRDKGSNLISIEIYVPFEMHKNNVDELNLQVYVNEKVVEEFSFTESGVYELNVECHEVTEWIDVRIETNSAVNPDGDKRELSYILNTVYQK